METLNEERSFRCQRELSLPEDLPKGRPRLGSKERGHAVSQARHAEGGTGDEPGQTSG